MSKRRDALRRGIRSLIHDTSRELADLEGREAPAENAASGVPGAAVPGAPSPAADDARPAGEPDGRAAPADDDPMALDTPDESLMHAEVMAVEVREVSARGPLPVQTDLEPRAVSEVFGPDAAAAETAEDASTAPNEVALGARHTDGVDEAGPGTKSTPSLSEQPIVLELGEAGGERSAPAEPTPPVEPVASTRKRPVRTPSKRGSKPQGARAERSAPEPAGDALDGVDPAQAQSRKGVCVAYFVDHACWHVANAYCNTALHVCVMRDCPVYHLHQVALERRFAGKYKHFW